MSRSLRKHIVWRQFLSANGGAVQDTDYPQTAVSENTQNPKKMILLRTRCPKSIWETQRWQNGRFQQFWDEAAKSRHIVESVPGFEQAIQALHSSRPQLNLPKGPKIRSC
ncbi:PREDICTED: uncharacterized protein LOC104803698 [Tarenaya hassleriana]|uniref:uncharacterized protein LOC104803698 n=1 Tax=Tarenaya hassleriana TaxID=28532 RepID=UPI00053C8DFC|nr:PREDICTED: uncharacterized protein LOC104803698 [Tarenaya hassleriana]